MRGRFAYFLEVVAFDREWNFVLSGEDSLSSPPRRRPIRSLPSCMRESLPGVCGISFIRIFLQIQALPLILIEWPIEHMPGRAASALSVSVRDLADSKSALCYVVVTHMQSVFDLKQDPFLELKAGVVSSNCPSGGR